MLYEKISDYFAEMGIKQTVVARKSGMTKQALSESLRGARRLTAEEYIGICDAIGVSTEFFALDGECERSGSNERKAS